MAKPERQNFIHSDELPSLKRAYEKAKNEQKVEFLWKGELVIRQFIKYVIEQMDSKYKT